MALAVCKRCGRRFAKANQAHECVPGCSVDTSFEGRPPEQRSAYRKIISHLRRLGRVHEDAVLVGVFLKRERKFAEVRPMARAMTVWLLLPVLVEHPRLARRGSVSRDRIAYVVKIRGPSDVDETFRRWLTLAYAAAG